MKEDNNKGLRLLKVYDRLQKGGIVKTGDLIVEYSISEKTAHRDIKELKSYVEKSSAGNDMILYDSGKKGYVLIRQKSKALDHNEILAVSKILLESRALCKSEINNILDKLMHQLTPDNRKIVEDVIGNEKLYYISVNHKKPLLEIIWDISGCIKSQKKIEILYSRVHNIQNNIKRKLCPVSIMFSEYYFYMIAFWDDTEWKFPILYRLDRIEDYKALEEHYKINYSERFQDGEFRKRVQFMYSGELVKVKFEYTGVSLEAVLDRLPTAKILRKEDNKITIEAEVYGRGIMMWLLSQGEYIKVIEPAEFLTEFKNRISKMNLLYE